MEANPEMAPENQPQANDVPAFEQEIQDTQETGNNTFNEIVGLPSPEETAPPKHEDTQNLIENEIAQPQQDFSQDEVNPDSNEQVRYQYWQSQAAKLQNQVDDMKE